MNAMDIATFKDRIYDSLPSWIDDRVDSLAKKNPRLKVASIYLKRGAKNYIHSARERLDAIISNASMFLCDENGEINAEMLFDDLIQMFQEMDEVPFGAGFVKGTFGKGAIRFALPDNPVVNMLFGDVGAIKITDADILELKNILLENS